MYVCVCGEDAESSLVKTRRVGLVIPLSLQRAALLLRLALHAKCCSGRLPRSLALIRVGVVSCLLADADSGVSSAQRPATNREQEIERKR